MIHYFNHVKSLYTRPALNGIDGVMELRSASPFELFLDLIFVIALSKLTFLFEQQTIVGFFEATLLFIIIYSLWHTLTTYTVMFMKKEINYWIRAMIFLVMLPLIFFLSIDTFTSRIDIMVFCFGLAISKLFLALIFKDSIVNAPLNNIITSNLYLVISRSQLISAVILLIASFVNNKIIFFFLLTVIALRELILVPKIQSNIIKKSFSRPLINKQLFMERQLLFLIVIFGESLLSIIEGASHIFTFESILHIALAFSIMFLFYVRISEEAEHNMALIETSTNLPQWLVFDYIIFLLFLIIGALPELFHFYHEIPFYYLFMLISFLLIITSMHVYFNLVNIKEAKTKSESIFYVVDLKTLTMMYGVIILLLFFHNSLLVIYILLLIFFGLHVLALPFRPHLISEKCDFSKHINNPND